MKIHWENAVWLWTWWLYHLHWQKQEPTSHSYRTKKQSFLFPRCATKKKSAYRTKRPLNGKNSLKKAKRNVVICKDLPAKTFISTPGEMPTPFFSAPTQAEVNASCSRLAYDILTQTFTFRSMLPVSVQTSPVNTLPAFSHLTSAKGTGMLCAVWFAKMFPCSLPTAYSNTQLYTPEKQGSET